MVQGITFENQNVTSTIDGTTQNFLMTDGVLTGCSMSVTSNSLSIQPGQLVASGRILTVDGVTQIQANGIINEGYGQLVLTINLSNVSSDVYNPDVSFVWSTTTTFPALTQDDINAGGTIYQIELAVVSVSGSNITGIVSSAPIATINDLIRQEHIENKNNPHAVTAAQLNAQVAYTSLADIGLTTTTANSYQVVHNAMPENSTLTIAWTGTSSQQLFGAFGALMPADFGTCVIRKSTVSTWKFWRYNTGVEYTGTYSSINSVGWKGWNSAPTMAIPSFVTNIGGAANGMLFPLYGKTVAELHGTWARIDFQFEIGDYQGSTLQSLSNYNDYGISISRLSTLTGLSLTADATKLFGNVQYFNSSGALMAETGLAGAFEVQSSGYLSPARILVYNSNLAQDGWPSSSPVNDTGVSWNGTLWVTE